MKTMLISILIVIILTINNVNSQRSPYAGSRPSGYKDRFSTVTTDPNDLANRFGENDVAPSSSSTQRLPYDAYGDTFLVNQLYQRPVDQRPFWLVNYEAIEAHRNSTGQGQHINPVSRGSFGGKK